MKKINIILLRSSPRGSKILLGAETIILTIVEHIDKNRFNPIIVIFKDENDEIPPLALEAKKRQISVALIILRGKFDFFGMLKLRRLILKNSIDIVHSHEYKSDLICFLATRFTSVKLIVTTHGWVFVDFKVKFYEILDAVIIRFFDKIVSVSEAMKRELLKAKIPSSKITVIETALDSSYLQTKSDSAALKKELNLNPDTTLIGTIGRISLERGHIYFLRAAKEILKDFPNSAFLIVGDGQLKENLVSESRKMGINNKVFFLGFREDIANILFGIDIFVSSSFRESFGIAVVEAMVAGKPVIATKVGIAPEIIKNGETGILIDPKNPNAIYKAVVTLLTNQELRKKIGGLAKQAVAHRFSYQRMVSSYEQTYLDLVKNEKRNSN